MSFSLRHFWDKCFEADRRYRAGLPPKALKQPWTYPSENIPRNWDEWSLDSLYWLFQAEAEKRRLEEMKRRKP